jgi:hypothetical protein
MPRVCVSIQLAELKCQEFAFQFSQLNWNAKSLLQRVCVSIQLAELNRKKFEFPTFLVKLFFADLESHMSTVFWYFFKIGNNLTLAWMAHISEACRADVSSASRAHVSVASRAHALLASWAPTYWSHIWIKEHVAASCRWALSGFGTRYSTLGLQVSYASVQDFGSQWLPGHSAPAHHWHSGYAFGDWHLPPMQGAFLPQGHPQWYVHRGELLGEHGGYFEQHASPIEPCGEQDEDHGW